MAEIEADAVETAACCSFCDKGEAEVRKLIAGHSAYICDECVGLCLAVVGAGEAGDDLGGRLIGVWGDFVARGQWTLAMMTGVLMQLASGDQARADAGVDGLEATAFALNQVRRPPPPPDPDDVLTCGFCAKRGGETGSLNVGHAGRICGECVEKLLEVRALSDPAYRAQVIERLSGLADEP